MQQVLQLYNSSLFCVSKEVSVIHSSESPRTGFINQSATLFGCKHFNFADQYKSIEYQ